MKKVSFLKLRKYLQRSLRSCKYMQYFAKISNSNGLIANKSKRHLKYRGHVYFEPIRPQINYQAAYLTYLKSHNNSYENISIAKGL